MPNKKKRIPFATGGWVNTQSSGDVPLSGEMVLTREMQEALAEVMKPVAVPDAPDLTLPFADIIERARLFVFTQYGSFEKFSMWGLIRPNFPIE